MITEESLEWLLVRESDYSRYRIDLSAKFYNSAIEENNISMAVYWDCERQKAEAREELIKTIRDHFKLG